MSGTSPSANRELAAVCAANATAISVAVHGLINLIVGIELAITSHNPFEANCVFDLNRQVFHSFSDLKFWRSWFLVLLPPSSPSSSSYLLKDIGSNHCPRNVMIGCVYPCILM